MQYKLDNTKAQHLQISNDAFHYLMYGEEPLDDDNLEEANEIAAMFSFGYSIKNWEYVKGENDLIEAIFVPYIKDDIQYDGQMSYITKNCSLKYKYIDTNTVNLHIEDESTGKVHLDCECTVVQFYNKPWIVFSASGDASMLSDYSNCCQIPLSKCN